MKLNITMFYIICRIITSYNNFKPTRSNQKYKVVPDMHNKSKYSLFVQTIFNKQIKQVKRKKELRDMTLRFLVDSTLLKAYVHFQDPLLSFLHYLQIVYALACEF